MKRLLTAVFVLFGIFEGVNALAIYQPSNIGTVSLAISSGTIAEIINSTATAVGALRYCTNCQVNGNAGALCISTGTATWGQFITSTGTRCQ